MYFLPSALLLIFGKIFGCGMMLLRVSLMLILHVIDPIKVSKSLGYNLGECLDCLRNYYVYVLIRERIKMFEMYCIMFKYYIQHFQPRFLYCNGLPSIYTSGYLSKCLGWPIISAYNGSNIHSFEGRIKKKKKVVLQMVT